MDTIELLNLMNIIKLRDKKNSIENGKIITCNNDSTYNVLITGRSGELYKISSVENKIYSVGDNVLVGYPFESSNLPAILGRSPVEIPAEEDVVIKDIPVNDYCYVLSLSPYLTGPVLKLDINTGEYIGSFGESEFETTPDILIINSYIYILGGGSDEKVGIYNSNEEFQSSFPISSFAIKFDKDSSNNIYVANNTDYKIYKYSSSGSYLLDFGGWGNTDGKFKSVRGVGVSPNDEIYVVSGDGIPYHRVQIFDTSGNFIRKFGSYGSGEGEFNNPFDICFDSLGNYYICETGNDRIQKFSGLDDSFILKWGSYGTSEGKFRDPYGVNYYNGEIYVADYNNNRVQIFNTSGIFQRELINDNLYKPYAVKAIE